EVHGAVEVSGFGEIAGGAEQNGGVTVMAAAVKAAGNGRAPFQVGVLFHRQRVHVGAQPDAFAAMAFALEYADDAGGANLLETDFGMGVQVAPDGGKFVGETLDAGNRGHVVIRWRWSEVSKGGAGRKRDHSV